MKQRYNDICDYIIPFPDKASFMSWRSTCGLKKKIPTWILKIKWKVKDSDVMLPGNHARWISYLFCDISMPVAYQPTGLLWRLDEIIDVKFTAQVQAPGNHSRHTDPAWGQNVSSPSLSSDQRGGAVASCIMYTGKGLALSTLLLYLETVPKIYCKISNFNVSISKYC